MYKKNALNKFLVASGMVLVWLPILAPFLFSAIGSLQSGRFRFDFLAPAELFPYFLIGGGLLVWAAIRRRSQIKLIAVGLAAAIGFLVLSQVAAVLTGLATGAIEPGGWPWVLVVALLGASYLGMVITGIVGIRSAPGNLREIALRGRQAVIAARFIQWAAWISGFNYGVI